jgi:Tol biopolymer transport system component
MAYKTLLMRQILTLMILFISSFCFGQNSSKIKYDLAYQKGSEICIIRFEDKKELKLTEGADPAISPDGYKLAYTKSSGSGISTFKRFIVVLDLNTKVEAELSISNINYYGASWSPDSKYIAFNIWITPPKWQVGIINLENSEVKIFKTNSELGIYQPTWSSDSKSIFAHDMSKVFKYDLSGKLLDSISVQNTFGENHYITSSTKFLYTSDNKHIIFNCGTNEFMEGVDGPVEAIFAYNTKSKNTIRLSPQKMYASDPVIESDNNIIFSGSKENEKSNCIYRFDFLSNQLNLVIKNARRLTISKK